MARASLVWSGASRVGVRVRDPLREREAHPCRQQRRLSFSSEQLSWARPMRIPAKVPWEGEVGRSLQSPGLGELRRPPDPEGHLGTQTPGLRTLPSPPCHPWTPTLAHLVNKMGHVYRQ